MAIRNEKGWAFYERLGRPKYVVAPMVDQSELAFRLLCRRHKADLTVTPMFHSRLFIEEPRYRAEFFHTCAEDRPLLVQFCGHDPEVMLAAAKMVENDCDGIDINLGCPQGIAKKGRYGSFLLDDLELLDRIVSTLSSNLKVPVSCKIRILPTLERTLKLVKTLENAGCSMLTVHGRTKEENKDRVGACNWEWIRIIRETVGIPVIANGGIETLDDINRCIEMTQAVGVMTSEAILENPCIFEGAKVYGENQDRITQEYLAICKEYMPAHLKSIRAHVFRFLFTALQEPENAEDRSLLAECDSFEEIEAISLRIAARRKVHYGTDRDYSPMTWYRRHYNPSLPKVKEIKDTFLGYDEDNLQGLSMFGPE